MTPAGSCLWSEIISSPLLWGWVYGVTMSALTRDTLAIHQKGDGIYEWLNIGLTAGARYTYTGSIWFSFTLTLDMRWTPYRFTRSIFVCFWLFLYSIKTKIHCGEHWTADITLICVHCTHDRRICPNASMYVSINVVLHLLPFSGML